MSDIDYNLRPAKHVERIMLAHAFRRLAPFGAVETYRYVGFGAAYFRDFRLFHRDLGITDMISIERDTAKKARYDFNVPFTCIRMRYGSSEHVLPTLTWDSRCILWLDYSSPLVRSSLADVELFFANACAGSVIVVTTNVQADRLDDSPLAQFIERVGTENVPPGLADRDFAGWGTAEITRRVIVNKIADSLSARNGARPPGAKLCYRQLFNFRYADGAKMATIGGMLYDEGQAGILQSCGFDLLPFIRTGEDPYVIEVPKLTYKELQHLQGQLPGSEGVDLDNHGVPGTEIERYRAVYRYLPTFTAADM